MRRVLQQKYVSAGRRFALLRATRLRATALIAN
jgi:hypothetical protein